MHPSHAFSVCTIILVFYINATKSQLTKEYNTKFIENIKNNKYMKSEVIKEWTEWIKKGNVKVICPVWCRPKKKHIDTELGEAGKLWNLGDSCSINFPKSKTKSLKDISRFLWGMSKNGFLDLKAAKFNHKHHFVTIETKTDDITFILQASMSGGQFNLLLDNVALGYDDATKRIDRKLKAPPSTTPPPTKKRKFAGSPAPSHNQEDIFKFAVQDMKMIMNSKTQTLDKSIMKHDESRNAFKELLDLYLLFWLPENILPQDSDLTKYANLAAKNHAGPTPLSDKEYIDTILHQTGRIPHLADYIESQLDKYILTPKKSGTEWTFSRFLEKNRVKELIFSTKNGLKPQRVILAMNITNSIVHFDKILAISGSAVGKNDVNPPSEKIIAPTVIRRETRSQGEVCGGSSNVNSRFLRRRTGLTARNQRQRKKGRH